MPVRVSIDEAVRRVAALPAGAFVGIDGLPLAGKSTLADRLTGEPGFAGIFLDDFVLPQPEWPAARVAFPFPYVRDAEFLAAVRALAQTGRAEFRPFDWSTTRIASEPRILTVQRGLVVEGVSALRPDLTPLYSLRIFVESDRTTTFSAAKARGIGAWEAEWRDWFLPSVDLYFASDPASRANLIVPGRGSPAID